MAKILHRSFLYIYLKILLVHNFHCDGMGYEPSVKGSDSDSLNIATFTIAALLQKKKPLAPRLEHCLRSWRYIACLDFRCFEGGVFFVTRGRVFGT